MRVASVNDVLRSLTVSWNSSPREDVDPVDGAYVTSEGKLFLTKDKEQLVVSPPVPDFCFVTKDGEYFLTSNGEYFITDIGEA